MDDLMASGQSAVCGLRAIIVWADRIQPVMLAVSDFFKHLKWLVRAAMWPGNRIAVAAMRLLAKLASNLWPLRGAPSASAGRSSTPLEMQHPRPCLDKSG